MVDEAAAVLEAVADDSWILRGARVLPNVVARVKDEGSESVPKAVEPIFAADVEKDANEVIARWEARRQEMLEALLDERISQEEFERDSEGDAATAEKSEATGDEELVEVETQISGEMDVDSGEDEVVSVATRKRAPSSPPKTVRKRARATAGGQETVVAACEASVKELEEALKGELSTDEEEMAREMAEEEVQRRLAVRKSTSAVAGDVEGGVRGSLGPSSKAKGMRRAN